MKVKIEREEVYSLTFDKVTTIGWKKGKIWNGMVEFIRPSLSMGEDIVVIDLNNEKPFDVFKEVFPNIFGEQDKQEYVVVKISSSLNELIEKEQKEREKE